MEQIVKYVCAVECLLLLIFATGCDENESSEQSNYNSGTVDSVVSTGDISDNSSQNDLDRMQDELSDEIMRKLNPGYNETETSSIDDYSIGEISSLYEYYQPLADEYENNPPAIISGTINGSYMPNAGIGIDGKIYFSQGTPLYKDDTIFTLDLETNVIDEVYHSSSTFVYWGYCNGNIYIVEDNDNGMLKKIDSNGNLLQSCEIDHNYYHIDNLVPTYDGIVFYKNRSGKYCMISEDFNTISELPYPQKTIEHGLTENIKDCYINGYYKGNLYMTADKKLYKLNLNTLQWSNPNAPNTYAYGTNRCAGKYMLSRFTVYDMEKDEEIAINEDANFNLSYFGGTLNIKSMDNMWYKVQYPRNNQRVAAYDQVPLAYLGYAGDSEKTVNKLNDTYYLLRDKYGTFLYTYELGDESEQVLYRK